MNLNKNIETIVITTEYDINIWKSPNSSNVGTPSEDSFVESINVSNNGNNIGKARTGYNVPFEFALEIIAAMIVEADTSPKFPSITVIKNAEKLLIRIPVIIKNRKKINILSENVRTKLKINLPRKISVGAADNFKANEVLVSSSFINTRDNPLIAVKNMTIQNRPDKTVSSTFSSPIENLIIDIVIITNINKELITYLFLISDLISFLNIVYV